MKHAHAMAYLEQLCSLGLGGELIMPAVLQALHAIIPSQHNAFYWIDAQYLICNIVDELSLPGLATRYDTALATQLESVKPMGYGSYAAPYPLIDAQRLAQIAILISQALAPPTVVTYVRRIYAKLEVRQHDELCRMPGGRA